MTQQDNTPVRHYNLSIPVELSDEIRRIARQNSVAEVEVIRKFIKLGLVATAGTPIYIKREDTFSEVEIFPKQCASDLDRQEISDQ